MTDDTWKNIKDRKHTKLKVNGAGNKGEAALKEAKGLYKNADKKAKSSAEVGKRKDIDALATEAQNAVGKGHQAVVSNIAKHHQTASLSMVRADASSVSSIFDITDVLVR